MERMRRKSVCMAEVERVGEKVGESERILAIVERSLNCPRFTM